MRSTDKYFGERTVLDAICWVTDSVEGGLCWKGFLAGLVPKVEWEGSRRAEREEGLRHTG